MSFFLLVIMLGTILTIGFINFNGLRSINNTVKSTQAYYAAEAGIEDALLRLREDPNIDLLNFPLEGINNININVTIDSTIGSPNIISQADNGGVVRKIKVVSTVNNQGTEFHYGVRAGVGGIELGNNKSTVNGNVFSSGSISGNGVITGNAITNNCINAKINEDLTYLSGGTNTCTVDGNTDSQTIISDPGWPISDTQIENWQTRAENAGNIPGQTFTTTEMDSTKISGSSTISGGSVITLKGTIYVDGDLTINNGATIQLSSSYGSLGGVIVVNGRIVTGTDVTFCGSCQSCTNENLSCQNGSYLLVVSKYNSDANPAIYFKNNSRGGILYAKYGGVEVENNTHATEITAKKIIVSNNAVITYDSGFQSAYFSSGPGGSWETVSWQEE